MIYRHRRKKSGYSIGLLRQHIKIEFGRRVVYVPFNLGLAKPFHSLLSVLDSKGQERVTHIRRKGRMTIGKVEYADTVEAAFLSGYRVHRDLMETSLRLVGKAV